MKIGGAEERLCHMWLRNTRCDLERRSAVIKCRGILLKLPILPVTTWHLDENLKSLRPEGEKGQTCHKMDVFQPQGRSGGNTLTS